MTRELHCCCQVEKLYLVITPIMILVFWIVIFMPLFKASWKMWDFGSFIGVTIWLSSVRQGLNFFPINFSFVTRKGSSIYFLVLIRICPMVLVTSCSKVTCLDPTASQSVKLLVTPHRSVFEFSSENEWYLHCLSCGCREVLSSGECSIYLFCIWAFWVMLLITVYIPISSHGEHCTS